MSEWKTAELKCKISRYRGGWFGVWDALLSALHIRPRIQIPADAKVTVRFSTPVECNIDIDFMTLCVDKERVGSFGSF